MQGLGKRLFREHIGQSGLEYMILIGVFLSIFVLVYSSTFSSSLDSIRSSQSIQATQQIADSADNLYKLGGGKQTIFVNFPSGIESASAQNKTISLRIQIAGGIGEAFSITKAQINGSLPTKEGLQKITLEVVNNVVEISYG